MGYIELRDELLDEAVTKDEVEYIEGLTKDELILLMEGGERLRGVTPPPYGRKNILMWRYIGSQQLFNSE
jgi:hypothetical protein